MHFNRFDLNLLVALDALLEEKNVTRAAERLFMSQPAMSGALQKLRERFNDPLLIRVGRTMELTPRANSLIQPVREILLSVQSTIDDEPDFDPATARRSFTISMSDFVATAMMPQVIRRVYSEAPGVKLQVVSLGNRDHERLESGRTDFIIRARMDAKFEAQNITENLRVDELFKDEWVCVADANHPTLGDTLSLEEYVSLPHVSHDYGRRTPMLEKISHAQASLDLHITASAPNFSTLMFMLPETSMIAIIPKRLATMLASLIDVKLFVPPVDHPKLDEVLIWHERNELDSGHQWIRRVIQEVSAELD